MVDPGPGLNEFRVGGGNQARCTKQELDRDGARVHSEPAALSVSPGQKVMRPYFDLSPGLSAFGAENRD